MRWWRGGGRIVGGGRDEVCKCWRRRVFQRSGSVAQRTLTANYQCTHAWIPCISQACNLLSTHWLIAIMPCFTHAYKSTYVFHAHININVGGGASVKLIAQLCGRQRTRPMRALTQRQLAAHFRSLQLNKRYMHKFYWNSDKLIIYL